MLDTLPDPTGTLPVCPNCSRTDRSYKLSRIYLDCSARVHQRQPGEQPQLEALLNDLLPEGSSADRNRLTSRLVQLLAPPAGRKRMTRLIHPDWMMVFLCAVGLIITYRLSSSQPETIPVIVTLLGASLLVYWLARRSVLERYLRQYRQELEGKIRVERAVGQWMRLYICTREPCIYDPTDHRAVPLDQLSTLLNV